MLFIWSQCQPKKGQNVIYIILTPKGKKCHFYEASLKFSEKIHSLWCLSKREENYTTYMGAYHQWAKISIYIYCLCQRWFWYIVNIPKRSNYVIQQVPTPNSQNIHISWFLLQNWFLYVSYMQSSGVLYISFCQYCPILFQDTFWIIQIPDNIFCKQYWYSLPQKG